MARTKSKILIIDDDPVITAIYRKQFPPKDFTVEVAHDAATGVVALNAFEPDLVLLDLNMPGRGGFELLGKLRAVPKFKDLPIIVITGEPKDSQLFDSVTQSAVTGVMHKSEWSPAAVFEAVTWALGAHTPAARAMPAAVTNPRPPPRK